MYTAQSALVGSLSKIRTVRAAATRKRGNAVTTFEKPDGLPLVRPVTREIRIPMTYEQWLRDVDEDVQTEWVGGEAIVMRPRRYREAQVAGFTFSLVAYVNSLRKIGEVFLAMFEMRLGTIPSSREPDAMFIEKAHQERITRARLEGPADLVIEIVSDDSVKRDYVEKIREYAAAGVQEYWIAEGRDDVRGFRMLIRSESGDFEDVVPDDEGLLRSSVLAGFGVDPAWFEAEELPSPFDLVERAHPVDVRQIHEDPVRSVKRARENSASTG